MNEIGTLDIGFFSIWNFSSFRQPKIHPNSKILNIWFGNKEKAISNVFQLCTSCITCYTLSICMVSDIVKVLTYLYQR